MYDKIYTLADPMTDAIHRVLNGRIFKILKDPNSCLHFFDAITGDSLIDSTPVTDRYGEGPSIHITTESGTQYDLRVISWLIPTSKEGLSLTNPKLAEEIYPTELPVLVSKEDNSPEYRAYCDRKIVTVYTFEADTTEEQFRKYLESQGTKLTDKGDWWQEYDKVEGNGKTWTHTHIVPSTH